MLYNMLTFRFLVFCLLLFHSYSLINNLRLKRIAYSHQCLATVNNEICHNKIENADISDKYSKFERVLFDLFASSVAKEMGSISPPISYKSLIDTITIMVFQQKNMTLVHEKGKSILIRLFPPFILPMYKLSIAKFPSFSGFMNAWVTHWATSWLMGNSTIYDVEIPQREIIPKKGLLIEKCTFLEEAKCLKTCINACKIPTQKFFLEEMGLPVTLKPNITDYSCKFEFNVQPLPLHLDDISKAPCLDICSQATQRISNNPNSSVKSTGGDSVIINAMNPSLSSESAISELNACE